MALSHITFNQSPDSAGSRVWGGAEEGARVVCPAGGVLSLTLLGTAGVW